MDVQEEVPDRWWVADADKHVPRLPRRCLRCKETDLDYSHAVPVLGDLPLCQMCATETVADHPMTITYLEWLTKGDLRWWSPWVCQCEGCGVSNG